LKQHKSTSASDMFKALELIEFSDLIPPLQAELQGIALGLTPIQGVLTRVLVLRLPYQLIFLLFSVYREQAKSKKGSPTGGTSGSSAPVWNKSGSGAQCSKGKRAHGNRWA
jgi:hypothetical protein